MSDNFDRKIQRKAGNIVSAHMRRDPDPDRIAAEVIRCIEELIRADEAKKWAHQVAEASQRVLDLREEQEARVMILRADQKRRWTELRKKTEALEDGEQDVASRAFDYAVSVFLDLIDGVV